MADSKRRVEVCKCENCGNEAEMVVTCELVTMGQDEEGREKTQASGKKERKTFTCVNCGNEADMIVDI